MGAIALLAPASVLAQPSDLRYAEEPTTGVHLPTAALAGEHDATATTVNPAGLLFLDGPHFGVALDFARDGHATSAGQGGGVYFGLPAGGGFLPRLGYGISFEWLDPPRGQLSPDPGSPTRFSWASALALGENAALGLSWHHYFDDDGAPLSGVDTFDLGYSARFGAHLAAGFVIRDLTAPTVAGTPVQRRYELELGWRPTGDDRLELGLGGRIGETRVDFTEAEDVDGWLRFSARVLRGVYLRGEVVSQSLHELHATGVDLEHRLGRDWRATLGLELSFGSLGVAGYATGGLREGDDLGGRGGTVVLRLSPKEVPSLLPKARRIEKIELKGGLGQRELTGVITRLRQIRRDPDVAAVFVEIDGVNAGWASMRELRVELLTLRERGIRVIAYMVSGSTRQYFLASAADAIFVDPAGGLWLTGFSATSLYFKGLFDKLGVEAQFEKIEEYKSAPETWTRSGPSAPALAMRNQLYDDLYAQLVADIAAARGISPERTRELIDGGPYTAGDLQKIPDLVDAVVTPDQLEDALGRELGVLYPVGSAPDERQERWDYPKLAIIYVVGDIVDGESRTIPILGRELVGGETISKAIAEARADPEVVAIILRINSPGGSALASELMAREVFKTRGKKPILCSLGDIAASGGYFAAAGCDRILADPMSLTGSIGIFNGKFDLSGLLSKLGLSWVFYERGEHATMTSFFRGYTDEERALMKEKLHYYYGRFVGAVARGRGMTAEEVDAVGRGQVFTGRRAAAAGLVDQFGGLDLAITLAKQAAGLSDDEKVQLVYLPKTSSSLVDRLLGGIGGGAQAQILPLGALLPGGIGADLAAALPASVWAQPGVAQARLPFSIRLGDVTH